MKSSASTAGVQTPPVDTARLSVRPQLKRHIDIGNDNSIEPFAFFTSSLDLADAGFTSPVAQNTVGEGITFAKPQRYNIRAQPITPKAWQALTALPPAKSQSSCLAVYSVSSTKPS